MNTALARRSHVLFSAVALAAGGYPRFHFVPDGAIAAPAEGDALPTATVEPDLEAIEREFSTLQTEANTLLNTAATANRDLTKEEREQNENRFGRMKVIQNFTNDRARLAGLAFNNRASAQGLITMPQTAPGQREFQQGEQHRGMTNDQQQVTEELRAAFSQWAWTGTMAKKFATITTATSSNALLPRVIADPVVPTVPNTIREAMALVGATPVKTRGTEDMKIPVINTAAGSDVAETASSETENAPDLSETIDLNAYDIQSGSAYFSDKVLMANTFDLVSYIQTDMVYARELRLEAKIIAAIIADAAITQVVATTSTNGITYTNLTQLNNKLPKKWNRQQVILLGTDTYTAAEALVGDDGHPILIRDTQDQRLLRFNGTPVLRCDYLEGLTANKCVGIVIGFAGFRLRDAGELTLARYIDMRDKPAQKGFNLLGFNGHGYAATAIAKLKTPVS